jgi:hypothetical protein
MLQEYVSSVLDVLEICCKYFIRMLQKVDQDVTYVEMVVYVCSKRLFSMFHLFFTHMLQVCLSECCMCFTHMLQVFYVHIAYVYNGFYFLGVFCKCFCRMF